MTATILDGARVAADIRRETAEAASELAARGAVPGLAVILAGDDPASQVYVRNKEKGAREAGIRAETLRFPATVTEAMLLAEIGRLNADPEVDAILVQLPLPAGIGSSRILEAVDPAKDVDGFHPFNVGRLVQGKPAPVPCTPAGVMELLRRENVPLRGTRAVVLGRSDIVGKPMATLLTKADATVTVAHSKTRDLPALCREADLLVAAIGRPAFVTADFIREGAVVVDVGINRIDTAEEVARCFPGNEAKAAAFAAKGSLLVGDVHPVDVTERASRYTPVPGGVGPLTIARLLANTLDLCRARRRL
ncbi:MAG TPA: bifunctional 5,10-methylenetetrahydrofolate dehydrogenase/5,10-methenyltetrahydrofolate cyclohydrolase [Thermoanaerobaculia bacterium]|nr:bifunctional 5,10-methylenetetrahydrofolate dehydrogenase/5,10-methenyltetrahydrofolate cyclohydrolase [Thermoanaerobaculia bacterium]